MKPPIINFAHRWCNQCGCKVYISWNWDISRWDEICCCKKRS